ncbi:unnamed protein product [Cyclocybe aegerita]|uniref:Uncharacterized protein n=1 Tax=Cyclocybe aegerita TaxID=1973307 RepID=A0A8S0XKS8_CYCAE|nr:unnamed protein product [Cyclocybe aegerita]
MAPKSATSDLSSSDFLDSVPARLLNEFRDHVHFGASVSANTNVRPTNQVFHPRGSKRTDTFLNTDWVNMGHLQQWLDDHAHGKRVKQEENAASTAFDASKSLDNTPKSKPEPFDIELTRPDTAGDIKIRDIQRDRNPRLR